MLSARNLLLYAFLVAAAFGSGWIAERFNPKEEPPAPKPKGKIDYYSTNVLRTITDEHGKPKHVLYAEKLTHFQDDDHSELEKPVLTIYAGDNPPWVIHSERGTVTSKSTEVFLEGAVLFMRDADRSGRFVRGETSNVRVRPDDEYGETEDFVEILSPPDELSGVGMQVHFGKDLKVTVLSSVRRKHEVQPARPHRQTPGGSSKSIRKR